MSGAALQEIDEEISKNKQMISKFVRNLSNSCKKFHLPSQQQLHPSNFYELIPNFQEKKVKLKFLNLKTALSQDPSDYTKSVQIMNLSSKPKLLEHPPSSSSKLSSHSKLLEDPSSSSSKLSSHSNHSFPIISITAYPFESSSPSSDEHFYAHVEENLEKNWKEFQFFELENFNKSVFEKLEILKKKIMPICVLSKNNFDYVKDNKAACNLQFSFEKCEPPLFFLFCEQEELDDYIEQHKNRLKYQISSPPPNLIFVSLKFTDKNESFYKSTALMLMRSLSLPFFWILADNITQFQYFTSGIDWRVCSLEMVFFQF